MKHAIAIAPLILGICAQSVLAQTTVQKMLTQNDEIDQAFVSQDALHISGLSCAQLMDEIMQLNRLVSAGGSGVNSQETTQHNSSLAAGYYHQNQDTEETKASSHYLGMLVRTENYKARCQK